MDQLFDWNSIAAKANAANYAKATQAAADE